MQEEKETIIYIIGPYGGKKFDRYEERDAHVRLPKAKYWSGIKRQVYTRRWKTIIRRCNYAPWLISEGLQTIKSCVNF